MFTMAKWRNAHEQDIKNLITDITGFEESDENFGLCFQFATSNIRYHRFLDVDSHKVTKTYKGVLEKFAVHSQQDKSCLLQNLIDKFLDTVGLEGRETAKTDTHYALLSLLFCLADSPTNAIYKKEPRLLQIPKDEEKFDWFAYLMEGEETFTTIYADSDSECESDELSEGSDVPHVSDTEEVPAPMNPADPSLSVIASDASTLFVVEKEEPEREEEGESWLRRNLTIQYWNGQERHADPTENHSDNLARDWEKYREQINPLYSGGDQLQMTEFQIIREVLWMLSGVADSFIFMYNGQQFQIRENIGVGHLTDNSLYSCLKEFAKYGMYVQKLQSFTENVVNQSCSVKSREDTLVSQTYQAFCNTVTSFLKDLRTELTSVERKVKKQEEIRTLASLTAELQPWLHKIDVVHSVYREGVEEAEWLGNNCHRASHLLSVLYERVIEYDTLGHFANDMLELLLPMWIQTTKPYIDIIDEWITNGNLVDPMKEFLMRRNENVKTLDEKFWETSFTVLMPSETSTDQNSSLRKQDQSSSLRKQDQSSSLQKQTTANKFSTSGVFSHLAPRFLEPIILEVVLAGKSMEMLQDLGKLAEVLGRNDSFQKEKSLYIVFLESLQDMLGVRSHDLSDNQSNVSSTVHKEISVFTQQIDQQMKLKGIYDPLLKINFENVFTSCMARLKAGNEEESYEESVLSSLQTEHLQPVDLILQHCLYPHVKLKYSRVCTRLVGILKEDYHLMDYLADMRQFFLMEAGDALFDFYTPLFDKIRLGERWRDLTTINLLLQEALQFRFPEEALKLAVHLEDLPRDRKPINVTDCIKLHFKVPWPVDVVISSRCQEIYNQIFTFLLQVKRAKYCLDELRSFDLTKENILHSLSANEFSLHLDDDMPRDGRIHRMQILRMRLIYFVNSLHNYVMTRILHSTGLEFKEEIAQAQDLDQMIAIHNKYVNTIYERCLFHRKVAFLKDAVMGVLNLVLVFQALWDKGIDEISLQSVQNMEEEFTRLIFFLSSFLNNVIKRGSFPHLESLAFALITSSEHLVKRS